MCIEDIAAHWTPNPGGKEVILKQEDVLTVDFGVHVAGRIVDSAFTVAFDPQYDELLKAVEEATNTGVMVNYPFLSNEASTDNLFSTPELMLA
jgi:methionyl aminopeptidase